jgi:hypothetical protein
MKYTKEMIDNMVDIFDADGVWTMMQDAGLQDESEYIENRYFDIG